MQRLKNKNGQGLIEYILIVAIVAIGAMGVLRVMGHTVSGKFVSITRALQGGQQQDVHLEKAGDDLYQKRDMSDFMKNANIDDKPNGFHF